MFLDGLCDVCDPVKIQMRWRPHSLDAGDDLVIDAAINGQADVIATFNLRHIRGPAARFGIEAETPLHVLRRMA